MRAAAHLESALGDEARLSPRATICGSADGFYLDR
jgi:hypothetical protein